ncbi:succinylglutamate desuccinylase/aspartoacylase family protein [Thalassoglobus polymorphus]|uniref:Aspartoacylase n=1 Tax=Thalassoglobus polymorphus TaxID=2527994 RepID=A0A517QN03_9PLAN|nr:succinylglutamate desuccinylase/aspartoacylase family protein [Thalassoglobus polymorphus]QDT33001.1 aspartoacylase [Thalassoglobus polymorphus]
MNHEKLTVDRWGDVIVSPGETKDVEVRFSESYSGMNLNIPIQIRRGIEPGPTIFITAAVHGDEINGTGAIRRLITEESIQLKKGNLILVPVVNVLGFERHSRYLPDRRDLNRSFPGSAKGSQTSRMARFVFEQIVSRSDFGIDLHTASVRKTNFPNVRADLSNPDLVKLTHAFGCPLTINDAGPEGSLRRSACDAGCPTFILEAGEVWKVESSVTEQSVRGLKNVFISLGMIDGEVEVPPYRTIIESTRWVRSDTAGFLQFHVAPGDFVSTGSPIVTTSSLLGQVRQVIESTEDGIILGMTTLPMTAPGEPVCHIGLINKGQSRMEKVVDQLPNEALQLRLRNDLSTSFNVTEVADFVEDPPDDVPEPSEDEIL